MNFRIKKVFLISNLILPCCSLSSLLFFLSPVDTEYLITFLFITVFFVVEGYCQIPLSLLSFAQNKIGSSNFSSYLSSLVIIIFVLLSSELSDLPTSVLKHDAQTFNAGVCVCTHMPLKCIVFSYSCKFPLQGLHLHMPLWCHCYCTVI